MRQVVRAFILLAATGIFGCSSSNTSSTPTPTPLVQNLYVANAVANSVLVFPLSANGNVAPATTIIGAGTGLSDPRRIAFDANGNIYVTNGGAANSVTVYAANANGNATPTATIFGAGTGLSSPNGIALDGAGKIYVANTGVTTSITM
jgi:hypothetical protein